VVVKLQLVFRQEQACDSWFKNHQEVPKKAITLTIPAILSAKFIYCMVPGPTKAEAVRKTLQDSVSAKCPASILRKHENAILDGGNGT